MIVVTGATGKLGQRVIDGLLKKVPAGQVIAAVRSPEKARDFAARGVQVREADYGRPDTLARAFAGATRVLLISGRELGQRVAPHRAVVEAARAAGVSEAAVRQAVSDVVGSVAGTVGIVVPAARRSEVNAWLASWPEHAEHASGARAAVDSSVTPSGDDRVVVLTGEGPEVRRGAADAGAHALVPKGTRLGALLRCLRTVAAGRSDCPHCL